jgi:hypothetical protein
MPQQTIRFGVGEPDGPRSATWRLWVPARSSDVYAARRSLAGQVKASLHASGRWRVAFTTELVERADQELVAPGQDRVIIAWDRPPEVMPGLTAAFDIIVPWFEVVPQALPVSDSEHVVFYPAPGEGGQVNVYVFLSSPSLVAEGWPGQRSMGTTLMGTAGLGSGEKVWLVARTVMMPAEHRRQLEAFRRNAPATERRSEMVEDVSVLFTGIDENGAGWLLDMGLMEQRLLLDARGLQGEVIARGEFRDLVLTADLLHRPIAAQPGQHDLDLLLRRPAPVLPLLAHPDLLSGQAANPEPPAGQSPRGYAPPRPSGEQTLRPSTPDRGARHPGSDEGSRRRAEGRR